MDWITNAATRYLTEQIFLKYKTPWDTLQTRTEFMNADGFVINPSWVVKHLMTIQPWNTKPIAQLFWWRKETLYKAVTILINDYADDFSWIELNMGCPSNTVMKCWWGSDMLKHRPESLEIIKELSSLIKTSPLTFSIKTRAWLDENDKENQLAFLKEVSQRVDFLTIHGRTLKQLYMWDADISFMIKLKETAHCPIIANGWITNYQEAKTMENLWFDGVMIGQWAIGNPRIFTEYLPSLQERKKIILEHLELMIATNCYFETTVQTMKNYRLKQPQPEEITALIGTIDEATPYHAIVEFRKYLFQYIKGIPNAREIKQSFLKMKTYWEIKEALSLLWMS